MAIKIQNSTIIDDSRNIINAGITTTNELDVGIGGTIFKTGTNGYIGIGGTIIPKNALDVLGSISATGIITASTFYGSGIGITALGSANVYYVSEGGNDNDTGESWNKSFATIEKAFTVATSGDQVLLGTGTFTEVFPLTLPQGVTLKGSGLRSTLIQPTNGTKTNDALLINGDTTVEDLTIANFYRPGYAFRFADGSKTILRSPYIQRVTVLTRGTQITTDDPYGFDTPHNPPTSYAAGNGIFVDGSVVDVDTLEPAMLFNECTFITPNATSLEMTNGARAEWVNCWSYFADTSIDAYVGPVGVASTGKTRIKVTSLTGDTPAANDLVYYLNENAGIGTYERVGTAVTITSNNHGLSTSTQIYADFTSGSAADGFFTISEVTTNTFTFTHIDSGTTNGNVTYKDVLGFGTISSYSPSNNEITLSGRGIGRFQTAQERTGRVVTPYGDAKVSDIHFKFGTGSALFDGTGDYLQLASNTDFGFGTGNFTLESFIRLTTLGTTKIIYDLRDGSVTDTAPVLYVTSGDVLSYNINSSTQAILGTTTLSANTWYHIAVSKSGTSTKLFLNGVQEGSTYTDNNDYGASKPLRIGLNVGNANGFVGYIDELRVSNNARYTGTFTPTISEFVSDNNTKLLLHCDGSNDSTIFIDSTLVTQDVRFVRSGITTATATRITLADYQQFGADMRSIGCASVFGNVGIRANGVGVRLRLFAYNFGFIGSGKDFSQDLSLVDQGSEVVQLNGGRVQFVSIDQNGDFRVGKAFYVNEEEGLVTFGGGQEFAISSLSNLDITDGTNITTITPSSITVGNLNLFSNTVSTVGGDLTLDPSGISSTFVIGDLTVTGALNAVLVGQDGDKGDITVSANNTIWTIDPNVVTPNKLSSVTGIGTTVVLSSNPVLSNLTASGLSTFSGITTHTVGMFGTQASFTGVVTASSFSGNASSATYASTAGVATYSNTAGIATYATNAGIATNATNVIGGIASLTQLQVVGDANISGVITATSFIRSGGTSSQFLKADGSVDSTTYLTPIGSGSGLTGIVTAITAGSGISINQSTGNVTIENTNLSQSQWVTTNAGIHTLSNVGVGTTNPTEKLDVVGSAKVSGDLIVSTNNITSETHKVNTIFNVKTVTGNYSPSRDDSTIFTNGTFTISLPTIVGYSGDKYFIKNVGVGTITIVPFGAEKINGYSNMIMTEYNSSLSLLSDGVSGWHIF